MNKLERYLGLISGTSADAVDVALCEIESPSAGVRYLDSFEHPVPAELRARLNAFTHGKRGSADDLGALHVTFGELFAEAAGSGLQAFGIDAETITAIGMHGQTVTHRPDAERPFTLQLGDASRLSERLRRPVVADLRGRDIAAGGQGAPLACALHAVQFRDLAPCAVVNLGGIANVTVLPADHVPVLGFDTGPASCLMDRWIERHQGLRFDDSGQWATSGRVDQRLLDKLLDEPYFAKLAPKSTGTEVFNLDWLAAKAGPQLQALATNDVQATLLALTVATLATAIESAMPDCERLLLCGGGHRNTALVAALQRRLPTLQVVSTTEYGLPADAVEACLFAWLAAARMHQMAGNLPSVTGAHGERILGAIYAG